jgi:nitrate reductase cytochrome c-type subunit
MNEAIPQRPKDYRVALRMCCGAGFVVLVLGMAFLGGEGWSREDGPPTTAREPSIGGIPLFAAWPQNQKPDAAIIISAQTFGFLQPCGCTRPQKGGLERRAHFVQTLKAKGWPVAGVDLGDIYPEKVTVQEQSLLKYKTMMTALREMNYIAVGVGKTEFKVELEKVLAEYALQKQQPPFTLAGNVLGFFGGKEIPRDQRFPAAAPGATRPMVEDIEVATVGNVQVGVAGVVAKSLATEVENEKLDPSITFFKNAKGDFNTRGYLKQVVERLEASPRKPELRVLLFQGTSEEARMVATEWPQFQVIVCQADDPEPPQFPTYVGGPNHVPGERTLVIQLGHKGRYIGVVGAFKKPGGGYDLKYQLVPLGEEYITPGTEEEAAKANPILPILENYARQVKDRKFMKDVPRVPHPAQIVQPKLNLSYVGSDRCKNCHAAEFVKWQGTPHGKALEALEKVAKRPSLRQYDAECVVCHVVGFGYNTGFESADKTPHLMHVGCESCHGPGSGHSTNERNAMLQGLQSPWKANPGDKLPDLAFMKKMAELNPIERGKVAIKPAEQRMLNAVSAVCTKCHDHENDPYFDLYTYWPKVYHSFKTPPSE